MSKILNTVQCWSTFEWHWKIGAANYESFKVDYSRVLLVLRKLKPPVCYKKVCASWIKFNKLGQYLLGFGAQNKIYSVPQHIISYDPQKHAWTKYFCISSTTTCWLLKLVKYLDFVANVHILITLSYWSMTDSKHCLDFMMRLPGGKFSKIFYCV